MMVHDMRPMVDFVRIGERIEMPRLVLRYENGVSTNIVRLAQFFGLPTPQNIEHLNAGEADQRDTIQCDPRIARTVRRRFAEDFELFGYV